MNDSIEVKTDITTGYSISVMNSVTLDNSQVILYQYFFKRYTFALVLSL